MEEETADRKQGKAMAFLFRGEANIRATHGDRITNGRQDKDGQGNEESKASQSLRRFNLGPDQLKAEASSFGIPDLFFNGHATVIESGQPSDGILSVGS